MSISIIENDFVLTGKDAKNVRIVDNAPVTPRMNHPDTRTGSASMKFMFYAAGLYMKIVLVAYFL